jgi:hypothetical protein
MGNTNSLPNPDKLIYTVGVKNFVQDHRMYSIYSLSNEVKKAYQNEPDEVTDGGNDKHFFSFTWLDQKFFVAENEIGGLTVMLPEEY